MKLVVILDATKECLDEHVCQLRISIAIDFCTLSIEKYVEDLETQNKV